MAAYRYDPFGTRLAKTGTFDQPFQFSTKRYDARIGMVQYEFRNYLPHLGRWATRDPLGEAGGLNLYAFVGNNPVNWVDPWGLAFRFPRGSLEGKAQVSQAIRKHLDFLPNWALDIFFPDTPQEVAQAISESFAGGFACPLMVSGGDIAGRSLRELLENLVEHAHKHNPRIFKDDLMELVSEVIQRGDVKQLPRSRTAYYDDLTGRIVILDPTTPHGGTTFFTTRDYFEGL